MHEALGIGALSTIEALTSHEQILAVGSFYVDQGWRSLLVFQVAK